MSTPDRFYAYRQNKSGYCDSICLDCFRTISSELHKADLTQKEQAHVCNLVDLLNLNSRTKKKEGDQLDA